MDRHEKRHRLFAEKLKARLKKAEALPKQEGEDKFDFLSEDSIRYDYFSAIMQAENLKSEDLILEYPHPNKKYVKQSETRKNGHKKEIDCVILENGKPHEAIEFKYFAEQKNSAMDTTLHIGELFADCYRLLDAELGKIEQIVVLVSRKTMNKYITNPSNDVAFLFAKETCLNQYKTAKDTGFIKKIQSSKIISDTLHKKTYLDFVPKNFTIERIFDDGLPWSPNDKESEFEYVIAVFRVTK